MNPLFIGLACDLRQDYLADNLDEEALAEFDSDATPLAIEEAIRTHGHRVERIGNGRRLCRRLAAGDRWDLVFNIAEGLHGRSREAQVPALLELYDIPYTFSDPLVSAVTLDKAVTKRLIREAGLPTPPFAVVAAPEDIDRVSLPFPLFAKPIAEGTGKGIDADSKTEDREALRRVCLQRLRRYGQPVLVETFLAGREFTVGILGTGAHARALGTLEIEILDSRHGTIYSYETKEQCESQVRYSPPRRDALRTAIEHLALRCHQALECRDASRIDIRLDAAGTPHFLELNPLPGLHPTHSDLPMIATHEGMSYRDLIGAILASAVARQPANQPIRRD